MLFFALCLGLLALAASAMFSGSEIGFYRVPRIRLKLEALGGDRTSRRFLWLANNPSFFVATVLVGNNIANNLISLAAVMAVQTLFPQSQGILMEIGSTLLLAPFLFVYGELFPKYVFLNAPSRFLRLVSPVLMFCFLLFLPLTTLLWLLNRLMAKILNRPREPVRMSLARADLGDTFAEGREAGVLTEPQRRLADGVFVAGNRKVRDLAVPLSRFPHLRREADIEAALRKMRESRLSELPVFEGDTPIGYVRGIDLELLRRAARPEETPALPVRDFVEIVDDYSPLAAMALLQSTREPLGCVVDQKRNLCIGLLYADRLRDILLGESLADSG